MPIHTSEWTKALCSLLPKSVTHQPGKVSNLNLSFWSPWRKGCPIETTRFSPRNSLSPWEYRKSRGEIIKKLSKMSLLVVKVFWSAHYLLGNDLN